MKSKTWPDGFFDAITMFHVMEHLHDPLQQHRAVYDHIAIGASISFPPNPAKTIRPPPADAPPPLVKQADTAPIKTEAPAKQPLTAEEKLLEVKVKYAEKLQQSDAIEKQITEFLNNADVKNSEDRAKFLQLELKKDGIKDEISAVKKELLSAEEEVKSAHN